MLMMSFDDALTRANLALCIFYNFIV